ncbi:TPM domain-containing protein [Streptomyces orinoci]|uniref:TPM domain-containing protein n=1 Tax=Streptomyces orinoci TaxID=67339 RepID=A0ABV3JW50_STRON|nr:TPM domain-containing protein [Streptomyces orinoci]
MTRLLRRYRPGAPGLCLFSALLALFALLLPAAAVARADAPLDLDARGGITDTVGALGHRRIQVETALNRLHATHRLRLFVTYVHDFSGRLGHDWADATADRNGLGPHDVLLAIATYQHQFAVSVAPDSGIRPEQINQVAAIAIAPALAQHDWAGAAIGAADGYAALLTGQPVRAPVIIPGRSDPGGGALLPGSRRVWASVAAGLALCALGLHLGSRRAGRLRREEREEQERLAAAGSTTPGLARLAQPLTPLPDLEAEAARNLVETDDAVRTSAEELAFAIAQLGERATQPFAEAVGYARGELADAFRLRMRLDETPAPDPEFRRHTLDEICSRCTSANRRLDAESSAFDRLRDLRNQAAAVLRTADEAAQALAPRVGAARQALDDLAPRCAPDALAPVATYPGEARDRLTFATAALAEARRALNGALGEDTARAAVSLRAAEGALSQARTLTTAALRRIREIQGAERGLRSALVDAAAAREQTRHPPPDALAELDLARKEVRGGRYDPLAVLRRVDAAAAGLDAAAGDPAAAGHRERGRAARALLLARAEVAGARDFITTHRGAVGSRARTRLAEAERHLARGRSPGRSPGAALPALRRADALARQARALADFEVAEFDAATADRRPTRALGGALLGGIVLAGLLPATFGGGATRGRLAGP